MELPCSSFNAQSIKIEVQIISARTKRHDLPLKIYSSGPRDQQVSNQRGCKSIKVSVGPEPILLEAGAWYTVMVTSSESYTYQHIKASHVSLIVKTVRQLADGDQISFEFLDSSCEIAQWIRESFDPTDFRDQRQATENGNNLAIVPYAPPLIDRGELKGFYFYA